MKVVNREWEHTFGWTLPELLERNGDILSEVYPDAANRRRAWATIAAAKAEWTNFSGKTRDGNVIDTSWAVSRLSDGTSVCIGEIFRENTSRSRAPVFTAVDHRAGG